MFMLLSPEPQSSTSTAQPSPDKLGLGKTSGQRGAEILAGFRAEKHPTPETIALSRWSGRIIARMLMRMATNDAPANFTTARFKVIEALTRRALATTENATIVEIACGLSPRGLLLAKALPQAQVIEIDLPDVVRDKRLRLQQAKNVQVPANLQWIAADLAITPLAEVLNERQVDVVSAEGLLPYFSPAEITSLAKGIWRSLKPGGKFIADIPWREGVEQIRAIMGFFSRQAGEFKGMVNQEDDARKPLLDAGYKTVNLYRASQFADELKLPLPLIDVSFFIEAQKDCEQSD
ncbi:MAG TPA: class I SAM-dependent methyltransferase [Phototrophicaceae bacterium]|nr:class I SAM-dependent methyltransferase [Phototrophicaceae bacterium]